MFIIPTCFTRNNLYQIVHYKTTKKLFLFINNAQLYFKHLGTPHCRNVTKVEKQVSLMIPSTFKTLSYNYFR